MGPLHSTINASGSYFLGWVDREGTIAQNFIDRGGDALGVLFPLFDRSLSDNFDYVTDYIMNPNDTDPAVFWVIWDYLKSGNFVKKQIPIEIGKNYPGFQQLKISRKAICRNFQTTENKRPFLFQTTPPRKFILANT